MLIRVTIRQTISREKVSFRSEPIPKISWTPAIVLALCFFAFAVAGCEKKKPVEVELKGRKGHIKVKVDESIRGLVAEEDLDADKKITEDDAKKAKGVRGDQLFEIVGVDGARHSVKGTYFLSNLLQELVLARDRKEKTTVLDLARVYENPVKRISRSIKQLYWDGLTRRVDQEHMPRIIRDTKQPSASGSAYIYLPAGDKNALGYFSEIATDHPQWKLKVVQLPESITPQYVRNLDGRHGILALALEEDKNGNTRGVPFVVPGGRFNEMYGWDSYFEALGLLVDGRLDLAKAMVDNFVYQITNYGKILNANRSYYLTRSQPPFLTSMALAVYRAMDKNEASKAWLRGVLQIAIKEYEQVWTTGHRLDPSTGLSRYYGEVIGACPEVEPGHYDAIVKPYADKASVDPATYLKNYLAQIKKNGNNSGKSKNADELERFFKNDRAVRESGHDTTYRFDDRTIEFLPVDLNSLLYKIETDIAKAIDEVFAGELAVGKARQDKSAVWFERARRRKALINQYMWDAQRGMFFDYDVAKHKRSTYESATTFYPLWAGLADKEQAAALFAQALPLLEMPGGVVASTERSRGPVTKERLERQWDYPNGWAPHQMLIWKGLRRYGYQKTAERLTYRWLYMITKNAARYNGTIPEKFNVVSRTHKVFAEYGNVGTKFDYITKEGFGWMNASYQVGLKNLPSNLIKELEQLKPPEKVFSP